MSSKSKFLLIAVIIVLAAGSRLIDHAPNFTPIAAMAIFGGAYLKRWWGIFLPLGAMLASDLFIGFYEPAVMASVYLAIALAFGIGYILLKKKTWYSVGLGALSASIVFFLLTNFAVWAFSPWYPHTLAGLLNCFTLALPFFRNTILGDMVYTSAFFGLYESVIYVTERKLVKVKAEI